MAEKVRVLIDAEIQEFIPDFVEHRRSDLAKMRRDLEALDFTELETAGHKFKGCGKVYGFDLITDLGIQIERAAQNQDKTAVAAFLDDLAEYFDNMEIAYVTVPPAPPAA